MNIIGVSQHHNAMVGGESRNCLAPGGETNNTKDIWIKNKDAKPIGEDLKAFASKMKSEVKETATEIGHDITGSENSKMNCALGIALLSLGSISTGPAYSIMTTMGGYSLLMGVVGGIANLTANDGISVSNLSKLL